MEAWNRVQGPPRGDAEGEELIHEGHEGTRSLGYQVRGVLLPSKRTLRYVGTALHALLQAHNSSRPDPEQDHTHQNQAE